MKEPRRDLSINAIIEEAWGAHQVFRFLGFPPEDIYVVFGAVGPEGTMYEGEPCAGVLVKQKKITVADGPVELDFIFTIAPVRDVALFAKRWQAFIAATNNGKVDKDILNAAYEGSFAYRNKVTLIEMLKRKGFVLTPTPAAVG
jgi:hypothetical protein